MLLSRSTDIIIKRKCQINIIRITKIIIFEEMEQISQYDAIPLYHPFKVMRAESKRSIAIYL